MESVFVMAQMAASGDPAVNLERARDVVLKAKRRYRPDFIIFPEVYMSHFPNGTDRGTCLSTAQGLDGPFVTGMRELAAEHGLWMVFGMNERVEDPEDDRNFNTTVMVNSQGELVGHYRKTHMFDAFGFQESKNVKPGEELFQPVETPFGKIGLFVCYEVRFPELARDQTAKGADIIIMPTAWMRGDLKSLHFRALVTARAVENTVFILACNQCGRDCIGESVAVDPMGVPIACGNEREDLIACYVDIDRIGEVRSKLPSYKDRRPELYRLK